MPDTPASNEMAPLIIAYLDGSIIDADAAALERWIESSPACARAFSEIALLHRHLTERANPDTQTAPKPKKKETEGRPQQTAPPLSAAGVPMYRKGYEPQPFKLGARHVALAAAAALLVACGLAVYVLTISADPKPDPVDPNQPGPSVATLIQSSPGSSVSTPHGFPAEGEDYAAGEYKIATGTAEFMLTNAVNVKLRGDTRMVMRNDMNVSLSRGTVDFVCPPDAKGFAVNLPGGARVVDLGTAFTVRIGADGAAAVYVTEGLVRLETAAGHHLLQAEESLVATLNGTVREAQPGDLPQLAADVVKAMDPVAYWRFESLDDGVVTDETGAHHGQLVGEAPLSDSINGLGVDLSETTAHLVVPAHEALDNVGNRLTVSAWVKLDSTDRQAIVHNWAKGAAYTLEIYEQRPAFVVAFGPTQGDVVHLNGSSPMPTDRWVLLTGVYDGRTVSIYVDGELSARTDAPRADASVHVSRGPMTIGRRSEREHGAARGVIDEVAIFNRALTADQITRFYKASHDGGTSAIANVPLTPESETADR